jgi:hypothetical protein
MMCCQQRYFFTGENLLYNDFLVYQILSTTYLER